MVKDIIFEIIDVFSCSVILSFMKLYSGVLARTVVFGGIFLHPSIASLYSPYLEEEKFRNCC
ncbi:unnamed protein product [Moneuplotes crassus]|uniref:Uncharacterized protein n=1 Tax=Euplotes crassus TaxID=5936 RepID=A0AAD1XMT5_EUPCR|nr:unnamed protein product [Moneuplotes crassus]